MMYGTLKLVLLLYTHVRVYRFHTEGTWCPFRSSGWVFSLKFDRTRVLATSSDVLIIRSLT